MPSPSLSKPLLAQGTKVPSQVQPSIRITSLIVLVSPSSQGVPSAFDGEPSGQIGAVALQFPVLKVASKLLLPLCT